MSKRLLALLAVGTVIFWAAVAHHAFSIAPAATTNAIVHASGGAWSPSTPSNILREWLKSDALSLSDGTSVATWTATAGKDATQVTLAAQPVFHIAVKNGLPAILFDGVDDSIGTVNFSSAQAQPYTIMVVFQYLGTLGDSAYLLDGNDSSNRGVIRDGSGDWQLYATTGLPSIGTADHNWHILMVEWNDAATKYRFDGNSESTVGSTPGTTGIAGLNLGSYSGGSQYGNYYIGEVIVWDGILSSGDKTSAFGYADTRWAVY